MTHIYPIVLHASLHETIWGGRRLERDGWKHLPEQAATVGEAWETETSTIIQNGPYAGQTLGMLVNMLGEQLLGKQATTIFGQRFPLLAKFIDANAQLSVQVHPNDSYAAQHEGGKLGKTEFWYILAAEPDATVVHGFKHTTSRDAVAQSIHDVTLDTLLHKEIVHAGDVIFVPAGTVHAIGQGVLLYELQEYSDVTYRMYDYGRLSAQGKLRELHIQHSLAVSHYTPSTTIKVTPIALPNRSGYEERCLVACRYFVTCELHLPEHGTLSAQTGTSCVILTSLGANITLFYGPTLGEHVHLTRGQSMVLPAALGAYRIEGQGVLVRSYVPTAEDEAWHLWQTRNAVSVS